MAWYRKKKYPVFISHPLAVYSIVPLMLYTGLMGHGVCVRVCVAFNTYIVLFPED